MSAFSMFKLALLFLFIYSVRTRYWIELLELKLSVGKLLFVLAGVVDMTFPNALSVSH